MMKHKVQFEYTMHCLSEILYEYMATAEKVLQNGLQMKQ